MKKAFKDVHIPEGWHCALILEANITQCVPNHDLREISETSEIFTFPFEDFVPF